MSKIELLQALNVKICHDLAGPAGIIDNCLDLMDNNNPAIQQKAKLLVQEETANLIKKLKFFRFVYGNSDSEFELTSLSQILNEFIGTRGLILNVSFAKEAPILDATLTKIIMSLVSISCDNINFTGKINLNIQNINDIHLTGYAKDIHTKPENLLILKGEKNPISANVINCREYYIYNLIKKIGYQLSVEISEGTIEYKLQKQK